MEVLADRDEDSACSDGLMVNLRTLGVLDSEGVVDESVDALRVVVVVVVVLVALAPEGMPSFGRRSVTFGGWYTRGSTGAGGGCSQGIKKGAAGKGPTGGTNRRTIRQQDNERMRKGGLRGF